MRQFYFFISIAVIFVSNVIVLPATADELKTIGTINGSQSYDSAEEIIFTPSILLAINLYDNDGLPNQWEMDNFGNMNQDPNGDEDNDGLTNLQEYTFGTDPNLSRSDHDNDSLPDTWEAQYGKLSNLNGRNEDKDSDGISNWIEYKLGTDPTAANDKAIGIFYEYDKLGRIKKIERTPSQ